MYKQETDVANHHARAEHMNKFDWLLYHLDRELMRQLLDRMNGHNLKKDELVKLCRFRG